MKLLYLLRFLPHAEVRDSGGQDIYHYLDSLRQTHELYVVAFHPPGRERVVAQVQALCRELVVIPYVEDALAGRLWRAGWRFLLPRVYGRVFSLAYRRVVRNLLRAHQFDVIVVDGMMAHYGMMASNTPRVLDEVDVYATVAYQQYRQEKHPLRRFAAALDWLQTLFFELRYVANYEGVFTRSRKDARFLNSYLPEKSIHVLAPWFEGLEQLASIPAERPPANNLLFVGAMHTPKNVDAVRFFAESVFPLIRKEVPDAVFQIVGSAPPPSVSALAARPGIVVTGEVGDLTPYYATCAVNVVPLLTSGGIIVKTLNGMAAARPTVTSPAGRSGIDAQDDYHFIVVPPEPEIFAAATVEVLKNESRWQRFAMNGRAFVQAEYNWQDTIAGLGDYLQKIAAK